MIFRKSFISKKDEKNLVQAIVDFENRTSGEMRIHIENKKIKESTQRALEVFHTIGMIKTKQRNGVLVYVNPKHRKVAIIADEGINKLVKNNSLWKEEIVNVIIEQFKIKQYLKGLLLGVQMIGEVLSLYFPNQLNDVNELANQISR